ncbi:uncharacterized protein I303_106727 [Kwoniella dejecticola CBS 10117]|uniref:Uncharacterized protein n=1 Tax=Kwoniella dejecticola CBS 10117 TaxID=1296121 RepID=A0A1A5ZTV8_9TREE|nr:uncharacterized protein I303_08631 [Kwoniella dejecticola CBS 10117]OBR81246.1 hypothetical protein I303_08631 [Kwoniella dejecticola CBS 10117]
MTSMLMLILACPTVLAVAGPTAIVPHTSATSGMPMQTGIQELSDRRLLSDLNSIWGDATSEIASVFGEGTSIVGSVWSDAHTVYSEVTASAASLKAEQTASTSS